MSVGIAGITGIMAVRLAVPTAAEVAESPASGTVTPGGAVSVRLAMPTTALVAESARQGDEDLADERQRGGALHRSGRGVRSQRHQ